MSKAQRNYSVSFQDGLERRIKRLERDMLSVERSVRSMDLLLKRVVSQLSVPLTQEPEEGIGE